MNTIKKDILNIVIEKYADWTAGEPFACQNGCSHCCTQNVTMTATEGDVIFKFIRENNKEEWFALCLSAPRKAKRLMHIS